MGEWHFAYGRILQRYQRFGFLWRGSYREGAEGEHKACREADDNKLIFREIVGEVEIKGRRGGGVCPANEGGRLRRASAFHCVIAFDN